jgi:hypothetical protein
MSDQESHVPNEPIDVFAALAIMAEQLAGMAWQRMGLQHDMITGKIERDLSQAKAAIDASAALAGLLEPHLDESDKRTMQNLIRDLRMNYVQQSQGESS